MVLTIVCSWHGSCNDFELGKSLHGHHKNLVLAYSRHGASMDLVLARSWERPTQVWSSQKSIPGTVLGGFSSLHSFRIDLFLARLARYVHIPSPGMMQLFRIVQCPVERLNTYYACNFSFECYERSRDSR